MAIQWFPGHMNKARNEIKEIMPQMDVIIEVLDARIPYSSENPMVGELRGDKPVIKILNKADLADPEMTKAWMSYLERESGVKTLPLDNHKSSEVHLINELCKKLVPHKVGADKQIKAMIMGIPNVGKSTLINTLAGRIVAKTGNECCPDARNGVESQLFHRPSSSGGIPCQCGRCKTQLSGLNLDVER